MIEKMFPEKNLLLEKRNMYTDLQESLLTLRVLICSQYYYLPSFSECKVLYNTLRVASGTQ